ncbi:MAG TPA: MFS transporter [Fervidobacterium sp.]|nr:MFS transporter [Fervidobacterium sp.]
MNILLRNRNLLLMFLSILLSTIGGAIFFVSIVWTAASELGGASSVSLVLSFQALPLIITAPFAGLFVDKREKRKVLFWSSFIDGLALVFMTLLLHVGVLNVWMLCIIIFVQQFLASFAGPAGSAFIPLVVKDEDLSRANSIVTSASMLAQLIGLGVGGIIVASLGVKGAVALNAALFIISALFALFITYKEEISKHVVDTTVLHGIKDGFKYAWKKVEVKWLIFLEIALDFFGLALFAALPVMAKDVLKVGAQGYGVLQTMSSIGSLMCGLAMAFLPEVKRKYLAMTVANVTLGVIFSLIGLSTSSVIVAMLLFIFGLLVGYDNIIISLILQRVTDKDYRGRVFSFRSMLDNIIRPLGYIFLNLMLLILSMKQVVVTYGIVISIIGLGYLLIPYFTNKELSKADSCNSGQESGDVSK